MTLLLLAKKMLGLFKRGLRGFFGQCGFDFVARSAKLPRGFVGSVCGSARKCV